MNNKQSKAIRRKAEQEKNKIIADFITGENKDICILYVLDQVKKYRFKNRLKIAWAIIRGEK
jgi:hypothetical protein